MRYLLRHPDVALALLLLFAAAVPSTASLAANYSETFDSGTAQGWTVDSGSWAVAGGTYNSTADGFSDVTVFSGGAIWGTDFTYHASLNNQYGNFGNQVGLVYNYEDAANYYEVRFAPPGTAAQTAHLNKVIRGQSIPIADAAYSGGDPTVWFDVDVIRSGTSTTVKVNGVTVFSNVAQQELSWGKIGLVTSFAHALFDNVSVVSNPGPITRSGHRFPRLGAYPIGSPHNYDEAVFRDRARKYHVVIVNQWPGWQLGRSMTMAQVMQDIKPIGGTVGTKAFIYVVNAEMANPPAPGDAFTPVWDKINQEKWWLYVNGDGTTCTPSPCQVAPSSFSAANSSINNINFGPADAAGKNWIRWKADFDYGFNVVGDANDAPNNLVDGFFLDAVFWTPRIRGDWNRDGTTDCQGPSDFQPCNATEAGWLRDGYRSYFDYIRSIWRFSGGIQVGNIADWGQPEAHLDVLNQQLDGGVMESMIGEPTSVETLFGFDAMMQWYRKMIDALRAPKYAIFGHDRWASGDYRDMRYGLASTLMDDGYYYINIPGADGNVSYDPSQLQWFDEFNFDLGFPIQPRQEAQWSQGVWRRDFDNGIVLVNPKGNGPQTVNLGGTFRKLTGTQDPATNNGALVTSVTLADRDGIVLGR